jgi:hypothetical protein
MVEEPAFGEMMRSVTLSQRRLTWGASLRGSKVKDEVSAHAFPKHFYPEGGNAVSAAL